jgi:hypothetical protein
MEREIAMYARSLELIDSLSLPSSVRTIAARRRRQIPRRSARALRPPTIREIPPFSLPITRRRGVHGKEESGAGGQARREKGRRSGGTRRRFG